MNSRTLIFMIMALSTTLTKDCSAMEPETKTIYPLNNGLLTEIPGIISQISGCTKNGPRYIRSTTEKKDTLINLISYTEKFDASKDREAIKLFCPAVFKRSQPNSTIAHLGPFNKKKHRELLEAIRQNKALYYKEGQGALIYSLDTQPNLEICLEFPQMLLHFRSQGIEIPIQ